LSRIKINVMLNIFLMLMGCYYKIIAIQEINIFALVILNPKILVLL